MGARRLLFLILPVLASVGARAEGQEFLAQAQALEKQMQKIIAQAEPSIACILVSRSEIYRKVRNETLPLTDSFASIKRAGELGGPFNPDDLKNSRLKPEELKKLDLADPNLVPEAFGSGVVVGKNGAASDLILTNYHVVRDAEKIFVRLPGKRASYANIHAADPRSDLAVLKLLSLHDLKPLAIGDASKLQRGQFVLSLANPYAAGFRDGQPSASWGILSNIRRRVPEQIPEDERLKSIHYYGTLLQTDVRLNLGCSGGALLNLHGELIGLTTAQAAIHGGETPGGFALPLDAGLRRIVDVLIEGAEVEYGFLGVRWSRAPRGNHGPGVLVTEVTPGSPAAKKLQADDRILEVNGIQIHDMDDLYLYLGTALAGSRTQILVKREGGNRTIELELARYKIPSKRIASSTGSRPFVRGMRVDYASTRIVPNELHVDKLPEGVLVEEVQDGTPAAQAKLRPGEVITHVNDQAVLTPREYYEAVQGKTGPLRLKVGIESEGTPRTVVLP